MPSTIPKWSHYALNSLESFFTAFDATLKNLQINICTTKYTSIKKVHTTHIILFFLNHKRIPLKMLMIPYSFTSWNRCCKAKSTTPKAKVRKIKWNEDGRGFSKHGRTCGPICANGLFHARTGESPRGRWAVRAYGFIHSHRGAMSAQVVYYSWILLNFILSQFSISNILF
jgi:hypothetical protein